MQIAQLRYFTTIAQLENVSQAAELLHLSQSSLSKNLARLEAEVGAPLFDRSGRRLTLNAAGRRLLEYSTLTLQELECALDDIRLLSTGADCRIKIGAAGGVDRLTGCLAAFREVHPEAEFDLMSDIESLEHIDINDYDMLIYPAGGRYERFTGFPLCEEQYLLALSPRHPLAESPAIRPKALEGQSVVFLRAGRSYVEYPFRGCSALTVRFGSQCYVDTRELHRQLIASGVCIGFVSDSAVAFYQGNREVRLLPIQDKRFQRLLMVCFRREKHLSALAKDFRNFAIDHLQLQRQDVPVHPAQV